ncbi:hypothetical protein HDV62DRAFT_219527 [Trichoderma sp. SZMC 28011]
MNGQRPHMQTSRPTFSLFLIVYNIALSSSINTDLSYPNPSSTRERPFYSSILCFRTLTHFFFVFLLLLFSCCVHLNLRGGII